MKDERKIHERLDYDLFLKRLICFILFQLDVWNLLKCYSQYEIKVKKSIIYI